MNTPDFDEPDAKVRVLYYRERARQLLTIGETLTDVTSRSILLITAQDYLHMADAMERAIRASSAAASPARDDARDTLDSHH